MSKERSLDQAGSERDVIEIDLLQMLRALWKRAILIIFVTVLCGAAAFGGTLLLIRPTYRATFTAYVNNKNSSESTTSVTNADMSASQALARTYANILTSRSVLTSAAERINEDYTYEQLQNWVSVSVVSNTEIIQVNVTMTDPQKALELAQAIDKLMPSTMAKIVEGSSVQIIDDPVLPTRRYAPSYTKNAVMGALLGFIVICAIIILRELQDDTIRDENELERRFGVTIIGTIPDLAGKSSTRYGYGYGYAQKQNQKNNKIPKAGKIDTKATDNQAAEKKGKKI